MPVTGDNLSHERKEANRFSTNHANSCHTSHLPFVARRGIQDESGLTICPGISDNFGVET
jgi:hypothetical protein